MTFTLPDGLIDQIISAMENQEKSFLLRSNGLTAMLKQIKMYALAFQVKG